MATDQREKILAELLDVVFPYLTEEDSEARRAEEDRRRKVASGYSEHDTGTLEVLLKRCLESKKDIAPGLERISPV